MREVLGSRPGRAMCFLPPCDIWWSMLVLAEDASSKGTVWSVPAWFRADSRTNLIKQGEIVTGRPCGSGTQCSECSHGMREIPGSSPGRAMCFFLHCANLNDMQSGENDIENVGIADYWEWRLGLMRWLMCDVMVVLRVLYGASWLGFSIHDLHVLSDRGTSNTACAELDSDLI